MAVVATAITIPNTWRMKEDNASFATINNARENLRIGYVHPSLTLLFADDPTPSQEMFNSALNSIVHRNKSLQQCKDANGAILLSYLEAYYHSVTAITIRLIMTYEPRLLCDDIASCLLNSHNISAVREMERCGYVPTVELARDVLSNLVDANYPRYEIPSVIREYTRVVDYLVSKGFGTTINRDILNRL